MKIVSTVWFDGMVMVAHMFKCSKCQSFIGLVGLLDKELVLDDVDPIYDTVGWHLKMSRRKQLILILISLSALPIVRHYIVLLVYRLLKLRVKTNDYWLSLQNALTSKIVLEISLPRLIICCSKIYSNRL